MLLYSAMLSLYSQPPAPALDDPEPTEDVLELLQEIADYNDNLAMTQDEPPAWGSNG